MIRSTVYNSVGLFLACLFGFLITNSNAQEAVRVDWNRLDDFPGGARDDGSTFAIDGLGYYCCGNDLSFNLRNDCWQFDPNQNGWSEVASLNGRARQYSLGFSSDSLGYVFGGILDTGSFIGTLDVYDPKLDSWITRPTPLEPRAKSSGVKIGDFLYLFGGLGDSAIFGDFWRFNLGSGSWEQLDSTPFGARYDMIAYEIGGMAYFGLGQDTNNYYQDIWKYDVLSQQWMKLDDFPGSVRVYSCVLEYPDGAILAGGADESGNLLDEVYFWNVELEGWVKTSRGYPIMNRGMRGFTLSGKIFFIGGLTSNFTRVPLVYQLDFSSNPVQNTIQIWPNPVREDVSVFIQSEWKANQPQVEIFDSSGNLIEAEFQYFNRELIRLETSELKNGVYQILIHWDESVASAALIVVK
ncbi:T9SS type A sorting domain-containing protein [bacterium]|nr:T9SS type A sorting domain-containing protein [bacterium]MDC1221622.1 T9SS type A sorting domain-containing protein [Salibacteraceae bacterium]